MLYAGLDIHKRTISVHIKDAIGNTFQRRTIPATRKSVKEWAATISKPFMVTFEATLFSSWVYDELQGYSAKIKVANPQLLYYISKGKRERQTGRRDDVQYLSHFGLS